MFTVKRVLRASTVDPIDGLSYNSLLLDTLVKFVSQTFEWVASIFLKFGSIRPIFRK